MATQTHGNKTTFSWNGNVIGGLTSIGGVEITSGDLDITTLNDEFKKTMQDLPEAADIAISGYFDHAAAAGQAAMLSAMTNRTAGTVVITLPIEIVANTNVTWEFDAYLKSFKTGDFTNAVIPFSATLKPTEKPVLTTTGA